MLRCATCCRCNRRTERRRVAVVAVQHVTHNQRNRLRIQFPPRHMIIKVKDLHDTVVRSDSRVEACSKAENLEMNSTSA